MLYCYALNSFQAQFFSVFHDLTHEWGVQEEPLCKMHHSGCMFVSSKLKNDHQHDHLKKGHHHHKTLSVFDKILNSDLSKDPISKDKTEFKIDKHIVAKVANDFAVFLDTVNHNYIFFRQEIFPPYLKINGPPPKNSIT